MRYTLGPDSLPQDADAATLVGRAWLPDADGPAVVTIREGRVIDVTRHWPTVSLLLSESDPTAALAQASGADIGAITDLLANSTPEAQDKSRPWLLAPCDLQAVKAAGVTFVRSMLERVIEEQAKGDPAAAEGIRAEMQAAIGDDLRAVRPGSPEAQRLKQALVERRLWSQYLEVGIGPDAEIFTKAQPLSSVGTGAEIGIHPVSTWNNPEPEVVLAIGPDGVIRGAALGNDVNLRDVEGRSALLLGKAKDNNGSCAIGPFIRLLDRGFTLDDIRQAEVVLTVEGDDGFHLEGRSRMGEISRDITEIAGQAIGPNHQYPDGLMLFTGTMFAPIEDRDAAGQGFTHKLGDVVTIASARLGRLTNRVNRTDRIPPWRFGAAALMHNLSARGMLGTHR
ncbi:MAG: fumarylacetoacetate hydrolase family protein [Alphaproteobacteria bacterium]|nr:fumarylacetoacetate hydrolase family protein [Alphaproteobacteria bacterium]MBU0796216.1 fumarylacetoacetate hydrolase family protein [Alphaproteobacteria bacterium]MBU0888436.1 fumarylacetoacetate hydrolase family protein [Alphaproteobacteria bacterium]